MNHGINGRKNLWWVEKVLNTRFFKSKFTDFVSLVDLKVELWDGKEWREQGEVKAGMVLPEEFLIPIDTGILKNSSEKIKVRFRTITGFFEIDQVHIDFSENEPVKVKELKPDKALFNEKKDVLPVIEDLNNKRVKMLVGDKIDLVYPAPDLAEGYERGFTVALTGYYHTDVHARENPFMKNEERGFLETVKEALTAIIDAVKALPDLFRMNSLMNSVYDAPLEERAEKVIINNVLPWVDREKQE